MRCPPDPSIVHGSIAYTLYTHADRDVHGVAHPCRPGLQPDRTTPARAHVTGHRLKSRRMCCCATTLATGDPYTDAWQPYTARIVHRRVGGVTGSNGLTLSRERDVTGLVHVPRPGASLQGPPQQQLLRASFLF